MTAKCWDCSLYNNASKVITLLDVSGLLLLLHHYKYKNVNVRTLLDVFGLLLELQHFKSRNVTVTGMLWRLWLSGLNASQT